MTSLVFFGSNPQKQCRKKSCLWAEIHWTALSLTVRFDHKILNKSGCLSTKLMHVTSLYNTLNMFACCCCCCYQREGWWRLKSTSVEPSLLGFPDVDALFEEVATGTALEPGRPGPEGVFFFNDPFSGFLRSWSGFIFMSFCSTHKRHHHKRTTIKDSTTIYSNA